MSMHDDQADYDDPEEDLSGSEEPDLGDRMVTGGSFIYDAPEKVPALWGLGDEVLWAEGEPLIITGPTGVGKTTLGGQVVAARLGLINSVLSYPVKPGRKVLYLAMDRPKQIQRALARLLRSYSREVLDERLVVWQGPPPGDLARHWTRLRDMALSVGADTVIIDSLKDAAVKLSDEETGQGISRALNHCVASGIEVMVYHHQTKRGGDGKGKPNDLADVYGSGWITAGAGSVLLIWGKAGDLVVEINHLKQPAAEVGPLKVIHDHSAGRSRLIDHVDLVDLCSEPMTAKDVAFKIKDGASASDQAEVEKLRRRLDAAVKDGRLIRLPTPPGAPRTHPVLYVRASWGFTNSFTGPSEREGFTFSEEPHAC